MISPVMFGKIGVFSYRHTRLIIATVILLSLGSSWFLKDLKFDTFYSGFSVDDPTLRSYSRSIEEFGDSGSLVIRMTPGSLPLASLDKWTSAIVSEIETWEDIRSVEYSPFDMRNGPAAASLLRACLLNSGNGVLSEFASRFEPERLEKELRRYRKFLLSTSNPALLARLSADPLNLHKLLEPFLLQCRGNLKISDSSIFLDATNGRSRLLIIYPKPLAEDVSYSQELEVRIKELMENPVIKSSQPRGSDFALTGTYAQAAEASNITSQDMRMISLAALLLIFISMCLVFRKAGVVLVTLIPLTCSMVASFIFARIFFNPLTPVAIAFAAIILGLGIDISLHFTGRISQLLEGAESLEDAVRRTYEDCGPPVTIGIVTTAAAFFCLIFSSFESLSQFGLLVSGSLLITLVLSLLLFPPSVKILFPQEGFQFVPKCNKIPVRLFLLSVSHPKKSIAIGLFLLCFSIFHASNFRFEMDLFKGIPDSMESMSVAEEVAADFGTFLLVNNQVIIEAPSLEEAMEAQAQVDSKMNDLVQAGMIANFQSPSLLLPYPDSLHPDILDPAELGAQIKSARIHFFNLLEHLKIKTSPDLVNYYDMLEAAFPTRGLQSLDNLLNSADPRTAQHFKTGQNVILRTFIWPADDDGDLYKPREIAAEIAGLTSPNSSRIEVTGSLQFYEGINRHLRSEFIRVSLISLAVVVILSGLLLRKQRYPWLILLPLLSALPFSFACMSLFNLSFPPAGIGISAIILGIGIDDAAHILVRTQGKPLSELKKVLRHIAPLLFLTTISTMLGFGMLLLSRLYSLRAMGFAVAAGILACLLFTILFLPSLLMLLNRKNNKQLKALLPLIVIPAFLIAQVFPSSALQESELDRILGDLRERYNSTEAFSVEFRQTRCLQQMTEPMDLSGRLVFKKPHFLRVEIRGEENLNLYLDGESVWLEDLDFSEVELFSFSEAAEKESLTGILLPLFLEGIDAMKEKFKVSLNKTGQQDVIEMVPVENYPSLYRIIRFKLGSLSRITWSRVEFSNGDWIESSFSGWKKMPEISNHYFRYRDKE